jgi:hypothetical protein
VDLHSNLLVYHARIETLWPTCSLKYTSRASYTPPLQKDDIIRMVICMTVWRSSCVNCHGSYLRFRLNSGIWQKWLVQVEENPLCTKKLPSARSQYNSCNSTGHYTCCCCRQAYPHQPICFHTARTHNVTSQIFVCDNMMIPLNAHDCIVVYFKDEHNKLEYPWWYIPRAGICNSFFPTL